MGMIPLGDSVKIVLNGGEGAIYGILQKRGSTHDGEPYVIENAHWVAVGSDMPDPSAEHWTIEIEPEIVAFMVWRGEAGSINEPAVQGS